MGAPTLGPMLKALPPKEFFFWKRITCTIQPTHINGINITGIEKIGRKNIVIYTRKELMGLCVIFNKGFIVFG